MEVMISMIYDWLITLYRNVDFRILALLTLAILLPAIYFKIKRKAVFV
ncbi:hypothetical protein HNO89_000596 [Sporosarcina luteola]|nr:hypothetical protein [Sporosarcina luteola]